MKLRTKRLTIAVAVASAFMSMTVSAQEAAAVANPTTTEGAQPAETKLTGAAAASAASKQVGIQQVIVTATKRKEDASKVPISMSVLGGDELQAQHIGDYADITRSVPNVSFSGAGGGGDAGDGPGLSNIEIRGVSSSAGAATTGLYLDDVSMTQPNSYSMGSPEPKFFDIDHVEVLRGPQGTLYGASSMGGTIKFITNQPDTKEESLDFYTEVSQTKGANTANYNGNVVVNKPLIPGELAMRFGVQAEHIGGYIDQVDPNTANVIDKGVNWQDNGVMKLGFKWTPTKELTITPNIISQKVKTGDTDVSYTQVLLDAQPTGVNLPNYQTSKLTHEPGSDALTVPSLTINYSTQYGDLTSVTSFFKRDFTRVQDGQYTNSYQMAAYYLAPASVDPVTGATTLTPLANTIQGLPSAVTLENYVTQLSQEVRFASKPYQEGGSPYTWIVGGYLSNGFTDVHENDYVYGIRNAFTVNGQNPTTYPGVWNTPATPGINCTNNTVVCINSPAGVAEGFPADNTWHGDFSYHDMQQSIFGESSYYFEPTLHATVGVRYLHASQLHNSYQDLFYQGDAPTYTHNDTISGDKVTPKFAVVWETSPTNSVFATAAEGFRLGGANSAVPYQLCQLPGPNPLTYASDSLWSYEVGDKARFLNNTVTLNASAFYIKWKNMQQEIELSCSFDYNVNVGSATIYGGEFELKFKPVPSFVIDAAGGMTHATLDSSEAADSPASQGTLSGAVAGAWVPGVPNYNLALTATYSFDYNDDYFGFLRGGVHFIGSSYGGFDTLPNGAANPDYTRPAYHTVDVSTGVSWKEWEATLFVKNLTNNNMVIQKPIEQAQESGEVYRIPPRQIGVSLSAKF